MCGAVRGQRMVVDIDGRCYGCSLFVESLQHPPSGLLKQCSESMDIGCIDDPRLFDRLSKYGATIRTMRPFMNKEEKRSSLAHCGECDYLTQCIVCPASIGYAVENLDPDFVPSFQCAFNLAVSRTRNRLSAESSGVRAANRWV